MANCRGDDFRFPFRSPSAKEPRRETQLRAIEAEVFRTRDDLDNIRHVCYEIFLPLSFSFSLFLSLGRFTINAPLSSLFPFLPRCLN